MSDRARIVLLILEGMARKNVVCYPSNDRLAEVSGKSLRAVQEALDELENPKDAETVRWIRRVYTEARRPERLGIIMLQRIDRHLPAADSPECIEAIIADIRARGNLHAEGAEICTRGMRKSAPENVIPEKDKSELAPDYVGHEITLPAMGRPGVSNGADHDDSGDHEVDTDTTRQRLVKSIGQLTSRPPGDKGHRRAVNDTAGLMASALFDEGSLDHYRKVCWRVAKRDLPPQTLIEAFEATYGRLVEHEIGVLGAYFFRTLEKIESDQAHEEVERDCRSGASALHGAMPRARSQDRDNEARFVGYIQALVEWFRQAGHSDDTIPATVRSRVSKELDAVEADNLIRGRVDGWLPQAIEKALATEHPGPWPTNNRGLIAHFVTEMRKRLDAGRTLEDVTAAVWRHAEAVFATGRHSSEWIARRREWIQEALDRVAKEQPTAKQR